MIRSKVHVLYKYTKAFNLDNSVLLLRCNKLSFACIPEQIILRKRNRLLYNSKFKSNSFLKNHYQQLVMATTTSGITGDATNSTLSSEEEKKHKNRLALEHSPYLLQHASNPVDWYPWGKEAFEKAVKEDKMIFLSGLKPYINFKGV